MLSGPLHTYAGLLCFYLAQPETMRAPRTEHDPNSPVDLSMDDDTSQPNAALLRAARGWFVKAQSVDEQDDVAKEFIQLVSLFRASPNTADRSAQIDHPELSEYGTEDNESKDEEDGKSAMSESQSSSTVSEEESS